MNFEALRRVEPFEHGPDRRMVDLRDFLHVLHYRVDHTKLVIEERRQLADADVAVLVDGGCQDGAAVLAVPRWIIRSAPEE